MTAAVTGASGHVGANLVRMLLDRGDRVRVLIRVSDAALDGLDVQRFSGDVRDRESLRPFLDGADVLYHLAAVISIDGDRGGLVPSVNVDGVRCVAETALECGVGRMVHCSSIHAFDEVPRDEPLDETRSRTTERPGHPAYSRSKARGEEQLRAVIERGLDATICNPTGIIGPHDYLLSRMGRMLTDLCRRRLPALVAGGFDWIDVRDVARSLIGAARAGRTGENYLLSGRYASVDELAAIVQRLTGVRPPRMTTPMWMARMGVPFVVAYGRLVGKEPLYTFESLQALRANEQIRSDKARREIGHQSRPLEQTLRDTLDWFVEHGTLPAGTVLAR